MNDAEARLYNCRREKQSAFADHPVDLHAGARRAQMSPELYALYKDASEPGKRKEWFFVGDDKEEFWPGVVAALEQWFITRMGHARNVFELVALSDEIRNCERFGVEVKRCLLQNVASLIDNDMYGENALFAGEEHDTISRLSSIAKKGLDEWSH